MKSYAAFWKRRVWTWSSALLMLVWVTAAVALPKLPDPPSPGEPPEEPPPPGEGGGGGDTMTNTATPLYPFPAVGGPLQAGEAHAPIGLGALQPALTETDATLETPFGPVLLTRSYAKGFIGGSFLSPFGGRDWTHSFHSMVMVRKVNPLGGPGGCFNVFCTEWSVLTPEGEIYDFRPCTQNGNSFCYAGEAFNDDPVPDIHVQRAESTQDRNVQLRWNGTWFELLRPGRDRLVFSRDPRFPAPHREAEGAVIYPLQAMHAARTAGGGEPRIATLYYSAEPPCSTGEMNSLVPALTSAIVAGGTRLDFEWGAVKKRACPLPVGHKDASPSCKSQPLLCAPKAVWITGVDGRKSILVEYGYRRDGQGFPLEGALNEARYPSEFGTLVTNYVRTEAHRPSDSSTWEEEWRVVDDGVERFSQAVRNVHGPLQTSHTYEFITRTESATGTRTVRAYQRGREITCIAGWDYRGEYGCSGDADYFGPYYTAPGTYAAGQVQEVSSGALLLGDHLHGTARGVVTERSHISGGGKSAHNEGRQTTVTRREVECRLDTDGESKYPCPGVEDFSEEWRVRFDLKSQSDTLSMAEKNARGFWKEYLYTQLQGGPRSPKSEHLLAEGRSGLPASTYSQDFVPGTPASVPPHREWYDWEWVGDSEDVRARLGFEARLARIRKDSVMAPSLEPRTEDVPLQAQRVVHIKAAPETSQVMAVIQEGWTKRFSQDGQWSDEKERRFLATFSYTSYPATGGEPSEHAVGRVVETHGPCWVTSQDAKACDVAVDGLGQPVQVPVTRFEYEASHRHLTARVAYSACGVSGGEVVCDHATALRTEFLEYDARGNLIRSRNPNGVETLLSYVEGRLKSEVTTAPQIAPLERRYHYDGRKLMSVRMPTGDYHVTCYRKSSDYGCMGGTQTRVIQWRAVASDAFGRNWREKVEYLYEAGTDRLSQVRYLEPGPTRAQVRKVVSRGEDALGRLTRVRAGTSNTTYVARAGFDEGGNTAARGEAYHEPPPFCVDPSKRRDPACVGFEHDALDRLTALIVGQSTEPAACFEYDRGGNVSAARLGCEGGCGSCRSGVELRYEYDDFGRLLSVTEPYKAGPTRLQHDAAGNLLLKSIPGSAWLSETRFDSIGRAVKVFAVSSTGKRELLHAFDYDGALQEEDIAEGCPSAELNAGVKGRLQRRQDSSGYHWYVYDALGRTIAVYRQRYGAACQGGHSEEAPNSFFVYDEAGRLIEESYPHGLKLHYTYGPAGLASRVVQIDVSAPGVARRTIISNAEYEPYGGLRAYEAATTGAPTSVEWLTGTSQPTGTHCGGRPNPDGNDAGDVRALWVSRGRLNDAGSGDVFQQVYSWQGGIRVREDTCLLGQAADTVCYGSECPRTGRVTGGYDEQLRLVSAQRFEGAAQGAGFESRRFNYDLRGNRTAESRGDQLFCYAYQGERVGSVYRSEQPDSCTKAAASSTGWLSFSYDGAGRTISRGGQNWKSEFDYDGLLDESVPTALSLVYRTASVGGMQVESFYDSAGRRWRKEYPDGSYREFYWADTELREERIPGTGDAPTAVLDSYVWLEGVPVALVRGWQDLPLAPEGIVCDRDGETVPCGVYFPVVDPLGKPVLLLDGAGRVSGTGTYDPFGHVNRVWHPGERSSEEGHVVFQQPPSTDGRVNAVLRVQGREGARISFWDSQGRALGRPQQLGEASSAWSQWVKVPQDGSVMLRLLDGSVEGYEYRRYEAGAVPTWIPLRLPGQYHDEETDLFENWNRYYDAETGRYLQPEPLLMSGRWIAEVAGRGRVPPVYSYGGGDPINLLDPNGLDTFVTFYRDSVRDAREGEAIPGDTKDDPRDGATDVWSDFNPADDKDIFQAADGTWSFHVSVSIMLRTVMKKGAADKPSRDEPGSLAKHEKGHRDDYREGLSQKELNSRIKTTGFKTREDARAAKAAVGQALAAEIERVKAESSKKRDGRYRR